LLEKAECSAEAGRYNEALAAVRQILEADARNITALSLKGFCLARMGRRSEAIGAFLSAIAELPDHNPLRKSLAQLYIETDKPDLALLQYNEAVRIDPSDGESLLGLGVCRLAVTSGEEGIRDIRVAVQLDPELREQAEKICKAFSLEKGIKLKL
jgi:tetratricopeptide (TPR) repeat protein